MRGEIQRPQAEQIHALLSHRVNDHAVLQKVSLPNISYPPTFTEVCNIPFFHFSEVRNSTESHVDTVR